MKRTLLAATLVMMALGASAQAQETVVKAKGDGFRFLGKNLTTEGKIIPYSTIGADHYYDVQEAEITVYDEAFNKVKSFTYPLKEYTSTTTQMKALADITKKTFIKEGYKSKTWFQADSTFTTMDGFKKFILNQDQDVRIPEDNFFIDHNGNFAFHEGNSDEDWMGFDGMEYIDEKQTPTIRQSYYYYDPSDKTIYYTKATFAIEIDLDNAAFTVDESYTPSVHIQHENIADTEIYDYDLGCYEHFYGYITQNVFNKDNKFEFVANGYKEVAAPADRNTTFDNGLDARELENGKLVITKSVQDKYYECYAKVINEDGKELFQLPSSPNGYGYDATLYRMNGKTYLGNRESENGETVYVLYLVDNSGTGTGITELARTKAVKDAPTFNLQGVQVNKDTKGIVIQKGGAKYWNK